MPSTESCCVCGQPVSTEEDGGDGCQLNTGDWVCSTKCWEKATGDDKDHSSWDAAVRAAAGIARRGPGGYAAKRIAASIEELLGEEP